MNQAVKSKNTPRAKSVVSKKTAIVSVTATIQPTQKWQNSDDIKWAVRHWATRMSVKVNQIHLRLMKNKWASMSTSGRLTLNTELLQLPKELGEFAIVHELVHLLVPNHGKVFKMFMFAYLPDWEDRELKIQSLTTNYSNGIVPTGLKSNTKQ